MRQRRKLAAVLLASSILLMTGACTDDAGSKPSELTSASSTSPPASTPTTAPSTTPTPDSDEQAVIAAYKGWFETVNGMGLATDEEVAAALSPYGTEEIVSKTVTFFASKRNDGLIPGGTVAFGDIQVSLGGDVASVSECRDTSTETSVDIATGQVVAAGSPATRLEADLVRDAGGHWRIANYSALEGQC